MLALLLAAVVVPASADMLISVENAAGVRALLAKAGTYSPTVAPESLGPLLREHVGVDLLGEAPSWGLSPRGARLLAFSKGAVGLSAPIEDRAAAKRMLASWIAQKKGSRAGRVSDSRLLTASGHGASALLAGMARPTPMPRDLAAAAKGPLWLWARLRAPLRAVVLSIDASEAGLSGRGLATATGPILAGLAPAGCESGVACVRASLGPAGRSALRQLLELLSAPPQPELATAARVEERIEEIEVREIADPHSLPRALRIVAAFDGPASPGPAMEARVDLGKVDGALATMTPLDALRGGLAASAIAAHLVYGRLLRAAGPLAVTATPVPGNATELEVRLPLR